MHSSRGCLGRADQNLGLAVNRGGLVGGVDVWQGGLFGVDCVACGGWQRMQLLFWAGARLTRGRVERDVCSEARALWQSDFIVDSRDAKPSVSPFRNPTAFIYDEIWIRRVWILDIWIRCFRFRWAIGRRCHQRETKPARSACWAKARQGGLRVHVIWNMDLGQLRRNAPLYRSTDLLHCTTVLLIGENLARTSRYMGKATARNFVS